MHTYYYKGDLTGSIILSEDESNHAVKVMRSKEGDRVEVINGFGTKIIGEIVNAHPKKCEVSVKSSVFEDAKSDKVYIAIAPTKSNDRIEFFIEKSTEIGVDGIIPLMAKNNERTKVNLDRWKKVAISAVKQSKRFWLPEIMEPMTINQVLELNWNNFNKLIAYCEDLPEDHVLTKKVEGLSHLVFIGPEGDFTCEEVQNCEEQGFQRINLGPNRLRTETAGLVAVTLLVE